jgi:hypothetical protein
VEKETFAIVIDSHDGLDRVEVFLTGLPRIDNRQRSRVRDRDRTLL